MTSVFQPDQTRYELEQKLGEGLNCTVWRAIRFDFSGENPRTVALKLPKDQTSVPVLRREFETLQRINSVYCARVIAWESCGDQPAIALEWIDGVTLFEFAQKIFTSSDDAQISETAHSAMADEIIRQIHLGLKDLRSAHLFHGDLQPHNVMIDREGRIRLIDFASGRLKDGRLQVTPAFVSPAIWAGAELGCDGDFFALKVIREHLLDGFRHLPSRSREPRDFKPAKESRDAQKQISSHVSRLLGSTPAIETQVIVAEKVPSSRSKLRLKLFRTAIALSLILAATLSVRAEAPADRDQGTACLKISSDSWMRISMNGRFTGFAPLTLMRVKTGEHRLSWESAKGRGELRLKLKDGDTVRLAESRRQPGRLEVR